MSTPSEFLKDLIGNPVVVKLNSGVDYRGILNCLGLFDLKLQIYLFYRNGMGYGNNFNNLFSFNEDEIHLL